MSRRRHREDGVPLSLDSFLDIVTNVVGVLILVAVVTVLSAGDIAVSAGATALDAPAPESSRLLIECARGELFWVDEAANSQRLHDAMPASANTDNATEAFDELAKVLAEGDIGDARHRLGMESSAEGVAWIYALRDGAHGDDLDDLRRRRGDFLRQLDELPDNTFVYFVVHEDSFDVFREAREAATARGIRSGWHPIARDAPIRLHARGTLGLRVQ